MTHMCFVNPHHLKQKTNSLAVWRTDATEFLDSQEFHWEQIGKPLKLISELISMCDDYLQKLFTHVTIKSNAQDDKINQKQGWADVRSVPFKQITDNRYSLPQTCVLQQKHQSQALSAHIFSFDLEQMQKNSFSRWLSITQPAPIRPQLYTKVVFTQ